MEEEEITKTTGALDDLEEGVVLEENDCLKDSAS